MPGETAQPDILDLAQQIWGERNAAQSTRTDIRFGSNGSKSVRPKERTWFDHEASEGGGYVDLYVKKHGKRPDGDASILKTYDYHDADGRLIYQVVRKDGHKFLQRRPDGSGGWIWKLAGVKRIPYLLPELIRAPPDQPVFICEGEKDCDNLHVRGLVTTTNPGGAGKWLAPMSEYLRGRDVIILPDNDEPGEKHALDVEAKTRAVARSVTIHRLPGLPAKGDVSDWLGTGGTIADLLAIKLSGPKAKTNGHDEPEGDHVEAIRAIYRALRKKLSCSEAGNVFPTHANLLIILRGDPLLTGIVRLDEFAGRIMTGRPLPILDDAPARQGAFPRAMTDDDAIRILAYVQKDWSRGFSRSTVHECISVEAHDRRFHPVRDWLATLRWDGKPRIHQWLLRTFGCPDDEYHRAIGSKLMIAAVRRVRQPGVKFDHLVVLEGGQGIGKSTALVILFGRDWTTDDLPSNLGSKDAAIALSGAWCIELAEIEQLIQSEAETVKAFLSRSIDRFRPPYGRQVIEVPRQSVLVGTTNATDYLRDTTGNRRVWPVECLSTEAADLDWIAAERKQLWAEAAEREATGEAIWLDDATVRSRAVEEQEDRIAEDPWDEKVMDYVSSFSRVKVPEILSLALFVDTPLQTKSLEMRVTKILRKYGWIRDRLKRLPGEKKPIRSWVRVKTDE